MSRSNGLSVAIETLCAHTGQAFDGMAYCCLTDREYLGTPAWEGSDIVA